jgi:hypothetical protein
VAVVATCVAVAGVSPLFSAERISGCCRLKTTKHDCVYVLSLEQIAPFIRSHSQPSKHGMRLQLRKCMVINEET